MDEFHMPLGFKQKEYARFDNMNKFDLVDICRTQCTIIPFFYSPHRSFTNIDHILSHKANLNQFLKVKIVHSIFYDLNKIKLEVNNKEVTFI